MSWISDRLGIHLNLRPLAAPLGAVAGGLLGGPMGAALGAGLFKTADNKAHGDSWGHAIGQGALNAGLTYAGGAGLSKLRSAFGGGGEAAGSFVPSSSTSVGDIGGEVMGAGPLGGGSGAGGRFVSGLASTEGGGGGDSLLSRLGSKVGDVAGWAEKHPMAVSGAMQGAGQIANSGSENALRRAQTTSLDMNNQQNAYELDAKKKRDAALAPLIAAFQGQAQGMAQHPYAIAANPYTSRGF